MALYIYKSLLLMPPIIQSKYFLIYKFLIKSFGQKNPIQRKSQTNEPSLCQESNIDEQYIMIPSSIKNDFVSFRGFSKSVIQRSKDEWQILDGQNLLGTFKASLSADELPVGVFEWNLLDPKCNATRSLKLTKVNLFKNFCFKIWL